MCIIPLKVRILVLVAFVTFMRGIEHTTVLTFIENLMNSFTIF